MAKQVDMMFELGAVRVDIAQQTDTPPTALGVFPSVNENGDDALMLVIVPPTGEALGVEMTPELMTQLLAMAEQNRPN